MITTLGRCSDQNIGSIVLVTAKQALDFEGHICTFSSHGSQVTPPAGNFSDSVIEHDMDPSVDWLRYGFQHHDHVKRMPNWKS